MKFLHLHRIVGSFLIFSYIVNAEITTTQNVLQLNHGITVDGSTTSTKTKDIPVSTRNADAVLAMCPSILNYVFDNATPREEANAGRFEEYIRLDTGLGEDVDSLSCLAACCKKARTNDTCNLVFIYKNKCYHVRCHSNEGCLPKQRQQGKDRLQMMLVSPVRKHDAGDENLTWLDVIKTMKSGEGSINIPTAEDTERASGGEMGPNSLSFWKQPHKFRYLSRNQVGTKYKCKEFEINFIIFVFVKELAYDEDDEIQPNNDKRAKSISSNGDDLSFFGSHIPREFKYVQCELDLSEMGSISRCGPKEECVRVRSNSALGFCQCLTGLMRNQQGECVTSEANAADYSILEEITPQRLSMSDAASELLPSVIEDNDHITTVTVKAEIDKKLVVSVVSKEVRLPEKEVTLAAFTVPDEETSGSKYKYLWTLVTQPKGPMNGTISDQSQSKVRLSNLSEGLYIFKVSVSGDNGTYGETMANVTVLPEKRINRVPQVVIKPNEQTIRLPITNAILDGSTSTDDDKIISWHWEVVQGPIGYQPKLPEVNILQLGDLTSPGNYTFKLTVSDSDNVTNSTIANITVLKGTDYPPVANAGKWCI